MLWLCILLLDDTHVNRISKERLNLALHFATRNGGALDRHRVRVAIGLAGLKDFRNGSHNPTLLRAGALCQESDNRRSVLLVLIVSTEACLDGLDREDGITSERIDDNQLELIVHLDLHHRCHHFIR